MAPKKKKRQIRRPAKKQRARARHPGAGADAEAGAQPDAEAVAAANTDERASRSPTPHPALSFAVVGIGASAGGLEAFEELLRALPTDTGMAFVLVSHLSPDRPSQLAHILSRATAMPVAEVEDEPSVEPNHVYVIPPERTMTIENGALSLHVRTEGRTPPHSIDRFFQSLAADQRHRAIAVVLSGMANDGTIGIEEIKAQGGITFAQDASAAHSDMPRSAIQSGSVDFVLSPKDIAAEIGRIARHPYVAPDDVAVAIAQAEHTNIAHIVRLLHEALGVDFSHYKRNTLVRRITRRMVLHRLNDLGAYAELVQSNPAEREALYIDILINVTSFFRNPESYEAVQETVFPAVTDGRTRNDTVRVWVIGCSTGEEAYSIAMAYTEHAERAGSTVPLQVFATDLNGPGIEHARAGVYGRSALTNVSPERQERFFTEADGGHRIVKTIRDMCIFARHDAVTDPPFSRIDLISCRNMLIYFDPALQRKLIPTLHYALNPQGFLWLGNSESIGAYEEYFDVRDPRAKIFSKKGALESRPAHRATPALETRSVDARSVKLRKIVSPAVDVQREADRLLLGRYAPPGVLVNSELDILQFRGDTTPYLAQAPGRASLNLLKMLREGLLVAVRNGIRESKRTHTPVRETGVRVTDDGVARRVDIEVCAIQGTGSSPEAFVVVFDETQTKRTKPRTPEGDGGTTLRSRAREITRLQQELHAVKEHLQSVIEQQEADNEELQSANEEIQSANEELQSINEEVETSKEEIQSSNEELATVNDELHTRNLELSVSNNDMLNLLASVQMAIVMLGPDLRIRRFTPMAETLLNLIPSDAGRSISDLKLRVDVPDLEQRLLHMFGTSRGEEWEARDQRGCWYSVRIRPYRTVDNTIDGAVVLFVDVDSIKRSELALRESEARFETLADNAPVLIWVNGPGGCEFVNRAFLECLGAAEKDVQGYAWRAYVHPDDEAEYVAAYVAALHGERVLDTQCRLRRADGEYRWMKSAGVQRTAQEHAPIGFVGTFVDVTDFLTAQEHLRRADRSKNEFLAMLAHELRNPLSPLLNVVELLRTVGEKSPEARRDAVAVLERQIGIMRRLVDDLLDVARVARGKIELRRSRVDLAEIIRRSLDSTQTIALDHHHERTFSSSMETAMVSADPLRIEQVITNLLNNAAKFTPPGGTISVSLEAAPCGGRPGAQVRVSDNGRGIAPDTLEHIFGLFFQADQSLDRTEGGLGVGLTLARQLIELHGGLIEAKSAGIGLGSEFVVCLPLSEETVVQSTRLGLT